MILTSSRSTFLRWTRRPYQKLWAVQILLLLLLGQVAEKAVASHSISLANRTMQRNMTPEPPEIRYMPRNSSKKEPHLIIATGAIRLAAACLGALRLPSFTLAAAGAALSDYPRSVRTNS